MKKVVVKIFFNKICAKIFMRPLIGLYDFLYKIISMLAVEYNGGVHPKHDIVKYGDWFFSKICDGAVIVDIGANKGFLAEKLAEKASRIYAVEINEEIVREGKSRLRDKPVEYVAGNCNDIDYSAFCSIDFVIMSNLLEHIDERVRLLKKIKDDINWNGGMKRLLLRVPSIERDWLTGFKKRLGLNYFSDKTHFIEYDFETLSSELEDAGWKVSEMSMKYGEIYAIAESV